MEREKQGFSAPDASWFRGESIDYVRDRLLSRSARIYDWMDYGTVAGLVQEHLSGRRNRRLLIWSLLYVEEWSRRFLGAQRSNHELPHMPSADVAGRSIARRAGSGSFLSGGTGA